MSTIEIKNLSFGFDSQGSLLFDHTNLILQSDWRLGLIGRNGRGKTTLLRLLMGEYDYEGKINQPFKFTYFPQTVANKQQLTYYVLQELTDFEQWKIERELRLLGLDDEVLWREFASLSGGEQTKVLLALLFVDDINYPLIDEPTNHLDKESRQQVAHYLQQKKQGFILVSHDRQFINQVVDHVLSIEKSQLVLYQGDFTVYEEQKRLRDEYEQHQNHKLKKEIGRLKQTAAEKAEWSRGREKEKYGQPNKKGSGAIFDSGHIGAKAAKMMKRSKAIAGRMEQQIATKETLLKDIEIVDPLVMKFTPTHHKQLLKVEQLQLGYDQPLFQPISFEVNKGDRVAIQGKNGSGKSSIIEYLKGAFTGEATGNIWKVQEMNISYVRQNYEDTRGTLQEFAKNYHLSYEELLKNLIKLGVEREVFQTRIEQMSMGQRKRVELAKSLATAAELFIWDEPLNYLDVFNLEQLEQVINMVQPTMLVVEHDQRFIEAITTKVINLEKYY